MVVVLLVVAIFFRFYKIRDYVVFLGDEGRDMIVMRNIFVNRDLPFLGPTASVGGFYLGPIYYWMAAPFLFLSRFDPIGPSYMVAIFGVATVFLLYKFLKDAIGFWPAILASFLYATAPLIVRYSRSSWNPNPLPFFSLLMVYCIYLAIKNKKLVYYLAAGACFGVAIQLHYLSVILAPITALIIITNEKFKRIPATITLVTIGSFITFSPFLFFEIKNNFPNFRTILEFVTRGSTVGYNGSVSWAVADSANIFLEWITRLENTLYTRLYAWIASLIAFAGLIRYWKSSKKLIFSIGIVYFLAGVFFLRLYSGQLNDYYFGSIFPAPFVLFGLVSYLLWERRLSRIAVVALCMLTLLVFKEKSFFNSPPNRLVEQTQKISNAIILRSEGKPFNFALISPSNSDHAYRYFLEIRGFKPTQLEENVTEQLMVICEQQECAPLGHPIWEIAGFGMAEVSGEWYLPEYGFKIIKLVHHPSSQGKIGKPAIKGI